MSYTKVIAADDYFNDFKNGIQQISNDISLFYNKDAIFENKNGQLFHLDGLVEAIQCIEYESPVTKEIVKILVSQSLKAFRSSPFFSDFSFFYSIEVLKHLLIEKASGLDPIQVLEKLECSFYEDVSSSSIIGTSDSFFGFINKLNKAELSKDLILNSCKYAGLDGKIFIETNQEAFTTLEVKHSHAFSIETFDEFFFNGRQWSHSFVNCIVIDGIIESVSEINHLLESASKNLDPVILIARGFGDEVLQTLYVNMQRQTLNVFPLKLKNDENLINSFVDISVVCKTDPVSYLKGELISSIDYNEVSVTEHVEIRKGKLLITNICGASSTRLHLQRLRSEIEIKRKTLDSHTFDLYESSIRERIRSLSSRSVHVSLSKDIPKDLARKIRKDIDGGFRSIPIVRDYGMTRVKDLELSEDWLSSVLSSSIRLFFKDAKCIPTGSLLRSVKSVHENLKLLISTSGALVYDK